MGQRHTVHTAACIQPNGSYCAELEELMGIPHEDEWDAVETPVNPSVLVGLIDSRGDEWADPVGDEATAQADLEYVFVNGEWCSFAKERA